MNLKKLIWIASSRKDLAKFPASIVDSMGYGLYVTQKGDFFENAKVLHGFGGSGVVELRESDASGTYRVVYTTRMKDMIFILHAFQKKSKQGIKTPQKDMNLVKQRLKEAEKIYEALKNR